VLVIEFSMIWMKIQMDKSCCDIGFKSERYCAPQLEEEYKNSELSLY
jgi:hypothetical protein